MNHCLQSLPRRLPNNITLIVESVDATTTALRLARVTPMRNNNTNDTTAAAICDIPSAKRTCDQRRRFTSLWESGLTMPKAND